jgi:hypothetical protein
MVMTGGQRLAKLFLDCDVFAPTAFGKLASPESRMIKLVSGEWIFIVPLGPHREMAITYHPFQVPDECYLSVLQQSAQLILMMEDAFQGRTSLDLYASVNGDKISSGKLEINKPMPPPLLKWANLVQDAWILAQHFGVERGVKLMVGSLAREEIRMSLARSFITAYAKHIKLTLWIDQGWHRRQARCCIPFPFETRLGTYVVQLAVALFGVPRSTENINDGNRQVEFLVDEVEVCYKQIYDPQEEAGKTSTDLIAIVSQRYKDEMDVIYLDA